MDDNVPPWEDPEECGHPPIPVILISGPNATSEAVAAAVSQRLNADETEHMWAQQRRLICSQPEHSRNNHGGLLWCQNLRRVWRNRRRTECKAIILNGSSVISRQDDISGALRSIEVETYFDTDGDFYCFAFFGFDLVSEQEAGQVIDEGSPETWTHFQRFSFEEDRCESIAEQIVGLVERLGHLA